MELRHLKYFTAVAEELHFGRAAARLNISAPTLSNQILALENMLGAKLFLRRTKSSVTLTQTGSRFLIEAYATLKQAANAEMVGRRAARGDIGSIALGYIFSAGMSGFVSRQLVDFREKHPDVSLQLRRAVTFEQFRALTDDTLDVGLTAAPQSYPSGLTGFIVDRQPYYVAIPEGNPIAQLKRVTPNDIADEPFIAVSLEMEVGFGGGNIAAITPPGRSLRIIERGADIFSVITLCASGLGLSVMSEPMSNVKVPGLVFRKVEGTSRTFDLALVHRRNESAPAVKSFIDFMRSRTRVKSS
ncbi:LysR substrate-binding domain-containing protein [Undibacter mobilis]|uniref:LysR family transcriptional regulator n=1 Tax=Undibacter mobilis TaxID=2292256 RepID=A0A371B6X0_9BRAD|nr:LysR substrate-binding domain-containing protein [Undibacter mobilis]RDV03294.1 LysR family transcriptional regulator [Undibacter mobilis]